VVQGAQRVQAVDQPLLERLATQVDDATSAGTSPARSSAAMADGTVLIRRTSARAGRLPSSRALRARIR
jgi:hypothetical protein